MKKLTGVVMARQAAERIVRDGKDAGEVVRRVRALFKRAALEMNPVYVTLPTRIAVP